MRPFSHSDNFRSTARRTISDSFSLKRLDTEFSRILTVRGNRTETGLSSLSSLIEVFCSSKDYYLSTKIYCGMYFFALHRSLMSLESPISVRFSQSVKSRLGAIARRTGVAEAALIRIATEEFLQKVEETKSVTINVVDELRETPPTYNVKKK